MSYTASSVFRSPQNYEEGNVWIGQPTYTESVLRKYGVDEAKPVMTLVCVSTKLVKATEECELAYQSLYQSTVGSLLYLSTRSRPDIATKLHWAAVKRIFRYLRETTSLGLLYAKGVDPDKMLVGYSDSDWGKDCTDYKSTTDVRSFVNC